jgi:superfamily II DNA or RNA helicase/stress response protein SCP2
MAQILQKGANVSLTKTAPNCNEITIVVKWLKKPNDETEFDIDASAFMLTENNRVRNDDDFIFYNQSISLDNAIELINTEEYNSQVFKIVLSHIAAGISKVSITLTLHEAKQREQNFGMLEKITIDVLNSNKIVLVNYALHDSTIETALILADLYRYNGEWKFRAVGQGYVGGLEALARSYGINIDYEATQAEIKPELIQSVLPESPEFIKYIEETNPHFEEIEDKIKTDIKNSMELYCINRIIADILSDIEKNRYNLTYRKIEKLLERIGMDKRRNFKVLAEFDNQIKKQSLSLWCGRVPVESIVIFKKHETVTFRMNNMNSINEQNYTKEVNNNFAGKIYIANAESGIVLYRHQEQAFCKLEEKIIKPNKNPFAGLLVLPTGGGKTLTAAHWISKNYLDKGKKVLWIAHRHELLNQAKSTFSDKLAFNDIFENKTSFNYRIISGVHDRPINIKPTDDLIIASKDSLTAGFKHLCSKWIENNTGEVFLVIDEAHHATAKTYRKLIENIRTNVSYFQMLGLTATPIRTGENKYGENASLKAVFPDNIVYKVDMRDLVTLGILSEPIFEEAKTGIDFSEDFTDAEFEKMGQGFDISSIGDRIAKDVAKNKERNEAVVKRYVLNKDKYKQTIVFALNVNNAIALYALFRENGIKSDYIASSFKDMVTGVTVSSKDNKAKIEKFRNEETQVLINVEILTEGTDIPNVQSIFLARPTVSETLMTQMIGRGLRGLKAGGTKEAYIVGFIDEWQNKIKWVNPEKLFIEDNFDFTNVDKETKKQFLRLIAINKIEEFAILTNKTIDPEKRKEIENLSFIERFPIGVYQFKFLEKSVAEGDEAERNCEVLVYDNLVQSYTDFLNTLPSLFEQNNLTETGILEQDEIEELAEQIEEEFFKGTLKYPAYYPQDIKNILQYYAIQGELPPYIELKDREKYDIDKIASEIIDKDLGEKSQKVMIDENWENDEISWQAFFGFDKRGFVREINSAKARISYPELHQRKNIKPTEEKELRSYEKLTLNELREQDPIYEKWLRDEVFRKFTDKDGFYFSAESGYKSKNKLDFQIDHIESMHNGGLTVLENLRLLTRSENARKGSSNYSVS